MKILCPFHDDRDPSCSVNLGKGVFHCFACPAKGNVLEFVHQLENRDGQGVTLRQAAILLAGICGIEPTGTSAPKGARKPQDGPSPHGLHGRPVHPRKRVPGRS